MSNYSRQNKIKTTPFEAKGFETFYKPVHQNFRELEIFLVDFKTEIYQEEVDKQQDFENDYDYDEQVNRKPTYKDKSGIILFFLGLDSTKNTFFKAKAFLSQNPYFYLLLEDETSPDTIRQQIMEEYGNRIEKISVIEAYDAGDILFQKLKVFLKIEVIVPNLVPALRDKLKYPGIIEWREADIQYHHRVAIDKKLNIGNWYKVKIQDQHVIEIDENSRRDIPPLKLVAYDIETDNDRNKEPDPNNDKITMVSLYTDPNSLTDNVVIVNSNVIDCSEVKDFNIIIRKKNKEHEMPWIDWSIKTPEDDLKLKNEKSIINYMPMKVQIVENEKELILLFLQYLRRIKPDILTDFYGDKFDLPFFHVRAKVHGIDFDNITGFYFKKKLGKNFISNWMQDVESVASYGMFHLDAYLWNLRYSYLPKKDLGLKSSISRKLKITPIGRESLWQMSNEDANPAEAVAYAGSDGYVTWRYVKEIILDFSMSMGRMFPVNSSEILTKTAGALDDLLVDRIGHYRNIIAKQRYKQKGIGFFNDKINIQGITYTGGFVIAPNPGIWRKDLKYKIKIDKEGFLDFKKILTIKIPEVEQQQLIKTKKSYFDAKIRDIFSNEADFFRYSNNTKFSNCLPRAKKVLNTVQSDILDKIYNESNSLVLLNGEEKKNNLWLTIDNVINTTPIHSLKGLHLDVTSMYPSQIRQYKLQPSGIVDPDYCKSCEHREQQEITSGVPICAFDSPWTVKIATLKPCIHKVKDSKTPSGYCALLSKACTYQYAEESNCLSYDVGEEKKFSTEEFYKLDEKKEILVFSYENDKFVQKPLKNSYLARGFRKNQQNSKYILEYFEKWIKNSCDGARVNYLGNYPFRIESGSRKPILWEGFLYIDVKQKNSSFLISLESRFCQKAYDYMNSIMDMFYKERVHHKQESKRILRLIKEMGEKNEKVPENMIQAQKYHDSTQLGLKVPLNSIYGLLGMKGGVHNASLPSAGVTTSLSSRLIQWSAEILEKFGPITEIDTDGCWFFIPEKIPSHYKTEIGFISNNGEENTVINTFTIPIWELYLNTRTKKEKSNPFYWQNNGKSIEHQPKSLLAFEQDGPYDFQYVQGKKKYIVYNRNLDGSWTEKELTGLETKRADFSQLHKDLQERIIATFLEDWEKTSLKKLYQKAAKMVDSFVLQIKNGELAEDYFILPKTLKKKPEEYFSQGPEVIAAFMLRDIGYTIEPGIKVNYFLIKPIKDPKNNIELKVCPTQLFKLSFKDIKRFLRKRGIAKLEFQLGQIVSVSDIRKKILRIDYDSYIESLIGPGKISDRMIHTVAKKQKSNVSFSEDDDIEDKGSMLDLVQFPENHSVQESKCITSAVTKINSPPMSIISKENIRHLKEERLKDTYLQSRKIEKNSLKHGKPKSSKEHNLINSFLNLELNKKEIFVKPNNIRIKKLLPKLERFFTAYEPEMYYCDHCKTKIQVAESFSCPFCSNDLYWTLN